MTDINISSGNTLQRIESLWLAISVDETGEGLCGIMTNNGQWVPLIAADEARLPFVRAQAKKIAHSQHIRVRVIRLTTREEVEVFDGRS